MIVREYQNQVNLESFGMLNLKIFFNHGEVMIAREYQNQVKLESFRMLNLKIFFNHGEAMIVTEYQNQVNLRVLEVKSQNFLQPWWSNECQKVAKSSQSGEFYNVKFQNFKLFQGFFRTPWGRAYSDLQTPRSLARPRCSLRSRFNYWRTLQNVLAHIRRTQNMDSILVCCSNP